jgi:hypothetical protein
MCGCLALVFMLASFPTQGQELAPRAYWPGPTGLNVLSLGYVLTDGDVLVDPTLPVDAVDATTNVITLIYHRFFDLADRTATFTIVQPYADSEFDIDVESGQRVTTETSGLADLQLRLGINLLGAKAMTPEEFQQYRQEPPGHILGASIKVQVPTGEFNPDRVANVGTSRWSIKPELGYIHPFGERKRWVVEAVLGIWFYGDNNDFLGGTLEQESIFGPELHLVRRIKPGTWVSLDWNYYEGGQTRVDGKRKENRQQNSRLGVTFATSIRQHGFKVSYSDSLTVEEGGDYSGILLSYSYAWQ